MAVSKALSNFFAILHAQNHLTMKGFYDKFFRYAAPSQAHAQFCEMVYGKNLCQQGMAEIDQVDHLIEALAIRSEDSILELGCGNGMTAEYIHQKTGARITGIDFSKVAIQAAQATNKNKAEKLSFQVGNLLELDFPENSFDKIIAIDVLAYFGSESLKVLAGKFRSFLKEEGQIGILHTEWLGPKAEAAALEPENTRIFKVFTEAGFRLEYKDYSAQEQLHWQKKVTALRQLKPEFAKEGSLVVYYMRHNEASNIAKLPTNTKRRYFYAARKVN